MAMFGMFVAGAMFTMFVDEVNEGKYRKSLTTLVICGVNAYLAFLCPR